MDEPIKNIETFLKILSAYPVASGLIILLIMSVLWKSPKAIMIIPSIINFFRGKIRIDELLSAIVPQTSLYMSTGRYIVLEPKILIKDCTIIKSKLIAVLRICRTSQEALTISLVNVESISAPAIEALEMFSHHAFGEFSDIIVKVVFPQIGGCKAIDDFGRWLIDRKKQKNAHNLTVKYDRYKTQKDCVNCINKQNEKQCEKEVQT